METFSPHRTLKPFVECYWSWEIAQPPGELDPVLPDAAPELIVHLESAPLALRSTGLWKKQDAAFLLCAAQHPIRLSVQEPMAMFAIRFRPWGVSRFTRRSMAALVDHEIAPDYAFADFGEKLVESIRNARNDDERIAVADDVLSAALDDNVEKDDSIRQLHRAAAGGDSKGQDIAKSLGISERSFRRLWHDLVGIEQRKFFSLMRFHRAIALIDEGQELSKVAAECGYSDQSHLARDVKRISGLPASLLRERLGHDVFQDLYTKRPSAPWKGDPLKKE